MKYAHDDFPRRIMIALALVSFVPFVFLVFDLLFAACYIDDGCGRIDPYVPFLVASLALVASITTGGVGALIAKILGRKKND